MKTLSRNRWMALRNWPELQQDEIHIWKADLDAIAAQRPGLERTLDPDEIRRAGQYSSAADRDRYILSCAVRRNILARYLRTKPGELEFTYGPNGKPELANGKLRFNISHSYGLAVCAVSRSLDVGVDVERIRAGVEEEISGWFFSLRAIRYLEALPQPLRRRTFFQGWTRMEAYGKALGLGLTVNFENVEALLGTPDAWFRGAGSTPAESVPCRLQDFHPRKGYAGALAARGGECKLKYWTWQPRYALAA
ncbi:MAG: phosphopantetheine-protein transferase [Bryobacterales bacterium]|nr:phosphopantetheine-protein transferase [Bryobacterales bacterium]